jgi:DNA-binding NarL/FixJ family response regulator
MCPIRVVIADDYAIFRKGLCSVLSKKNEIVVSGEASNGEELISIVEQEMPDVILTDIAMPVIDGIQATSILTSKFPATNIIALSMFEKKDVILKMISAGAKGYLVKNADETEIVKAIKTVQKQEYYYSNNIISKIISTDSIKQGEHNDIRLTEKEMMVIRLICEQYSGKEIAAYLDTSIRSIESAKERIQHKIGAKNMVGIALYAVKKKLIDITGQWNK